MSTLIVSKTRMGENSVCIGAISLVNYRSLRLLNENGYNWKNTEQEFEVGQVWDLTFSYRRNNNKPHTEDVLVRGKKLLKDKKNFIPNLKKCFNENPKLLHNGSIDEIFDNTLKFTDTGRAYVSKDNVPDHSTCFWVSNLVLGLSLNPERRRYSVYGGDKINYIKYVGTSYSQQIIPEGTLLRFSLARWWSPEGESEKRCYLQLSGWHIDALEKEKEKSPKDLEDIGYKRKYETPYEDRESWRITQPSRAYLESNASRKTLDAGDSSGGIIKETWEYNNLLNITTNNCFPKIGSDIAICKLNGKDILAYCKVTKISGFLIHTEVIERYVKLTNLIDRHIIMKVLSAEDTESANLRQIELSNKNKSHSTHTVSKSPSKPKAPPPVAAKYKTEKVTGFIGKLLRPWKKPPTVTSKYRREDTKS